MTNPLPLLAASVICALSCGVASAVPGDSDNDGLRDVVETNTGVFVSAENTGTNPILADSDGDSMPDGMEISKGTNPVNPASKLSRPNIIYIVTDDLGYGDVGCFWQNQKTGTYKFATPNLDAMAAEGAMLTSHYVAAPICVSSRCSFLQGRSTGHASVRDGQFDSPLPNTYLLAGTLKKSGYRTVHIGKAGLSGRDPLAPTAHPLIRGFDRFFGQLVHSEGHDHYPRNGTTQYPSYFYDDYTRITNANVDVYTSDAWTGFAKKTIIEETTNHPGRPFFIYLALDTPHFWGQHPPTRDYPANKGLTGGIQWTGNPSYVNTSVNDPNRIDNPANKHPSVNNTWYSDAQRYVSMVRRIDDSVADLLQTLKDLQIDDNTLVVFTSDNGPSSIGYDPRSFESHAGFEGIKGDLLEGGIRVPTIAWWPGGIPATNQLSNIRKINRPCANYDWLATFADLAKAPIPSFTDGTSLVPTLTGSGQQFDKGFLYFEMYSYGPVANYPEFVNHRNEPRASMQAIRMGDFKGYRAAITSANDPFRIYNLTADPKESTDLAAARPDLQEKMKRLAIGARRPITSTYRPYDNAPIPAWQPVTPVRSGLKWKAYEGYWTWLPEFRTLTPAASGETGVINTAVRTRNEDFGLSHEGYLQIVTPGAYTFQLTSDTGASLWLHESHVIDNDAEPMPTKTSGPVQLSAGLHPIRLFYRHQGGAQSLELRYSGPGISMTPIPTSVLFQDGQPTVLQPDTASTTKETPVTVDVLANDTAENALILQSVGTPGGGSTSITGGEILYTPAAGFLGTDQFTYTVNDGVAAVSSSVSARVFFDDEIWIPLDEGAGTAVKVYGIASPVTGSLTGAADPVQSWFTGKLGKAIRFDGTDDQVVFPTLPLPAANSPRSFSCWIKTSNTSLAENQTIFTYGPASGGQRFTIRLAEGAAAGSLVAAAEALPGKVTGTKTLNDGRWHHLALIIADHDNNGVTEIAETKLFVDGLSDAVSSSIPGLLATALGTSACLGGSDLSTNCNFNGFIDDVRIFSRTLSGGEIEELWNDTLTSAEMSGMPQEDSDGDGSSDEAEETAGTDPYDAGSRLRIDSLERTPQQGFTLRWKAVAGRTYIMQESADLLVWKPVPGATPLVANSPLPEAMMTVPGDGSPQRFFRIMAMRTPPEALDDDGDGSPNGAEAISGTDPSDDTSFFRIHDHDHTDSGMVLRWNGIAGRTYRVEQSTNLKDWTLAPGVAPVVVTAHTPNASVTVPANAATKRFLRLQVMQTP